MKKMNKNKTRVITALWMGAIMIPFIFLGGYFFFFLMMVLSYIATLELMKMHDEKRNIQTKFRYFLALFSPLAGSVLMACSTGLFTIDTRYILFLEVVLVLFFLMYPLLKKELKITDGIFYMGAIIYGGFSFGLIGILRNVNIQTMATIKIATYELNLGGLFIFCYTLFTSMLTDIFAYEVGRRIGKHKLIEEVSPNKTIEGSIGGTLLSSILSTVFFLLFENILGITLFTTARFALHIIAIIALSILLSIISQCGDLIASKLKREYGIKDYGNLFPGHGGVMDRFDSLILTSFFMFIILALAGVVLC